ncbi:MAG: hypothetical protein APR63_01005 [Desulfuromonas sp. SDB]|nr:MAG: hypothetical protein APR63_01005 [Desulfuromonas sp. SDB]
MYRSQIAELLRLSPEKLFNKAQQVCLDYCGDQVHIRGIIEFSNYCCRQCLYCGLRAENKKIIRYRLTESEIMESSENLVNLGINTIVLQSGDDFNFKPKQIAGIIKNIKSTYPVALTLSIGERPLEEYELFKKAGADRYLLKQETADSVRYSKFHPGQSLNHRLKILSHLRTLGYEIGTGFIVGLPGQTEQELVLNLELIDKLQPDMFGIGPFIPQSDTPLGSSPPGSVELTLKVLAVSRIITCNSHIPATTALSSLDPQQGLLRGLNAGCNVIMVDYTPDKYRHNYQIYDHKDHITLEKTVKVISQANRVVGSGWGSSLKK